MAKIVHKPSITRQAILTAGDKAVLISRYKALAFAGWVFAVALGGIILLGGR